MSLKHEPKAHLEIGGSEGGEVCRRVLAVLGLVVFIVRATSIKCPGTEFKCPYT